MEELPLKPGITFLDLGCGAGNCTLAVAQVIGAPGVVVALGPVATPADPQS